MDVTLLTHLDRYRPNSEIYFLITETNVSWRLKISIIAN
jgi:hypothetical protein